MQGLCTKCLCTIACFARESRRTMKNVISCLPGEGGKHIHCILGRGRFLRTTVPSVLYMKHVTVVKGRHSAKEIHLQRSDHTSHNLLCRLGVSVWMAAVCMSSWISATRLDKLTWFSTTQVHPFLMAAFACNSASSFMRRCVHAVNTRLTCMHNVSRPVIVLSWNSDRPITWPMCNISGPKGAFVFVHFC
jgi:hypothetical protein